MNPAEVIKTGGLVVLPTDTVYGIGADPHSHAAVCRLLNAKGREETMPPPLLCATPEDALKFADPERLSADAQRGLLLLAQRFWPGALTLIIPTKAQLGWDLGLRNHTVAVRVPDDAGTRAILESTGPLAVTSANKTGSPPALTVNEAKAYFQDEVATYVDGGEAQLGEASTIADCSGWPPKELRAGALDWEEVLRTLEGTD